MHARRRWIRHKSSLNFTRLKRKIRNPGGALVWLLEKITTSTIFLPSLPAASKLTFTATSVSNSPNPTTTLCPTWLPTRFWWAVVSAITKIWELTKIAARTSYLKMTTAWRSGCGKKGMLLPISGKRQQLMAFFTIYGSITTMKWSTRIAWLSLKYPTPISATTVTAIQQRLYLRNTRVSRGRNSCSI